MARELLRPARMSSSLRPPCLVYTDMVLFRITVRYINRPVKQQLYMGIKNRDITEVASIKLASPCLASVLIEWMIKFMRSMEGVVLADPKVNTLTVEVIKVTGHSISSHHHPNINVRITAHKLTKVDINRPINNYPRPYNKYRLTQTTT